MAFPASLSPALTIHRFTRAESPEQYAQVLQLRTEVFVNEQQVPVEREQDAHEDTATFWLLIETESGKAIATGRMRPYVDQGQPVAKI